MVKFYLQKHRWRAIYPVVIIVEQAVWIEVRNVGTVFLFDSKPELSYFFSDEKWLVKLAYLADIFSHLNVLNLSLQVPDKTALYVQGRVNAFVKYSSCVWKTIVKRENFENFNLTQEFVEYVSGISATSLDTSSLSLLVSSHLISNFLMNSLQIIFQLRIWVGGQSIQWASRNNSWTKCPSSWSTDRYFK